MIFDSDKNLQVENAGDHWVIRFFAMASPCEVLIRCQSESRLFTLAEMAHTEAMRLEHKFSRYRSDNIVHKINTSKGEAAAIDLETSELLKFAARCHSLSGGRFDITSGALRKAWPFDGKEFAPDQSRIDSLLEKVGWDKVILTDDSIQLKPGMEIDFGGIGKEYAVDRVANMLFEKYSFTLMVNFGGDIRAISRDDSAPAWRIGIENPDKTGDSLGMIHVLNGAVATSGDAHRFCLVDGVRYGHILDPLTGWPVKGAPRSVTVLADLCTEAGLLSTMAILDGQNAEQFLNSEGVKHYCHRDSAVPLTTHHTSVSPTLR